MKFYCIKVLIINLFLFSCLFRPRAQAEPVYNFPEIGLRCPDFTLNGLIDFPAKKVSLKDFQGQWLILDFWSSHCTSCLKSFPGLDSLQKKFDKKIQFMLVGYNGGREDKLIRKIYEKYKQKYNLELAHVYDSGLFNQLGVKSVPHLFWIDNQSIIRAITTDIELTPENLQAFLEGKELNLKEAQSMKTDLPENNPFNWNKPLLINGNGGDDSAFLFRSILTKWESRITPAVTQSIGTVLAWGERKVFQATGASLNELYKLAYSGASFYSPRDSLYTIFYPNPVLELADPKPFDQYSDRVDKYYCYSFSFPAAKYSPSFIQETLQRDLQSYFGYQVVVETRRMPYWKLTCGSDTKEKLHSKEIPYTENPLNPSVSWTPINQSIQLILYGIWGLYQYEPPFINETGIGYNIDIKLDGVLTDFGEMKKNLEKNGLYLVKGEREIKVIVIRDGPNQQLSKK
jgi:thiol-disulfide isomerase/thioredoxin